MRAKVYVPSMHVKIVEEKQALRTCGARQACEGR